MLQESKTNELEYQRLSRDEMESRGILGRLVGICADFISPTRNGRKYPEKLWENVFNDPIMKERIDNGVCYGELGHPADREETDMEKIAVCMAEQPKKGSDGKLRAVFDILNTPNGRILKSLCDYGSTLGISSRGSGDLETDFDGQESVNPDTYNCEGFDVVLIPAVKEARLQYVTEALEKKRYNKTLREKLTESINKETEDHQKVINESLSSLGISLNEDFYSENSESLNSTELNEEIYLSKDWRKLKVGDTVKQKTVSFDGTQVWNCVVKEVYPDHIIMSPTEENFTDINFWVDDDVVDAPLDLTEATLTPEEKMDMWHAGKRRENIKACGDAKLYKYRKICKDKNYVREVLAIDSELQQRGLDVPEQSAQVQPKPEPAVKASAQKLALPSCFMNGSELHIVANEAGDAFISQFKGDPDFKEFIVDGDYVIYKDDAIANKVARALMSILDESLSESLVSIFPEDNKSATKSDNSSSDVDIENSITADDDGVVVEELQKSLDLNKKLDKKIVDLQEKLSVSYAKEINLQEELEKYKSKVIKLSRRLAEEKVLNEKLSAVQEKKVIADKNCKKLTESVKSRDAKITSLRESIAKKNEQVKSLTEQVQQLVSTLDERNNQIEVLTEKHETLNKDYQQMKETYSAKMNSQTELVEKYRNVAVKSVNKYIDTQAVRLGVTSAEIKNRLPESYSFSDIDRICEDLQEYKLSISSLPFNTENRLNEGMRVKATNVSQRTLVPVEEELDDLTLRLAGLK